MSIRVKPSTPCPKCGRTDCARAFGRWRVYCTCGHEGPYRNSLKRALEVWHRQPSKPPLAANGLILVSPGASR